MKTNKRKLMAVDEEALRSALLNAVLSASEAFAILDAVGVPRSSQLARSVRTSRPLKREQDGKVQP
jgi:hypothetical protein